MLKGYFQHQKVRFSAFCLTQCSQCTRSVTCHTGVRDTVPKLQIRGGCDFLHHRHIRQIPSTEKGCVGFKEEERLAQGCIEGDICGVSVTSDSILSAWDTAWAVSRTQREKPGFLEISCVATLKAV